MVMVIVILLFVSLFMFSGTFAPDSTAHEAVQKAGFTDIRIVERNNFFVGLRGGGREDVTKWRVWAKNPKGDYVEVYVFVGWPWKATTIRY